MCIVAYESKTPRPGRKPNKRPGWHLTEIRTERMASRWHSDTTNNVCTRIVKKPCRIRRFVQNYHCEFKIVVSKPNEVVQMYGQNKKR